jgi:hypothetical protein
LGGLQIAVLGARARRLMQARRKGGNIHHDKIVEKLEIARTIGLVTDYRVSPVGPARQPGASVTVWPSANAGDEGLRNYLARLLEGLVSEQAIMVVAPVATDETRSEEAPRQKLVHLLDRVRLMGSALVRRNAHLHGLATAGAMLICAAVVLNVGPFAKAPNISGLSVPAGDQAAQAIMEQPNGSGSISWREVDARISPDRSPSAVEPEDVSEQTRSSTQQSFVSIGEIAALESQPARQEDEGGKAEGKPAQQDAVPAAPAAQPQPDHASSTQPQPDHASPDLMKRDTIVGVWAPDAGTCSARSFRDGVLPTVINTDGAWAGHTFCLFTKQKQTETGWSVVAKCSNPGERWTSNVRLTVNENRLTWTSKRGTQAYTRCAPDVLMAQAR